MTRIVNVSQREMKRKTGMGKALGYSLPEEDKILVRKDLPKDLRKEVLAHEEEHMEKGEEGPFIGALIGAGLGLLGASKQASAAKKAAKLAAKGSAEEIEFARESRDLARQDQEPWLRAGSTALDALMSLTGLGGGAPAPSAPVGGGPYLPRTVGNLVEPGLSGARRWRSGYDRPMYARAAGGMIGPYAGILRDRAPLYNVNEAGPENVYEGGAVTRNQQPQTISSDGGYVQPPENPGGVEGGYKFQTDPGYQFRFGEGMRALERSSAAKAGLLSGGFARKAIRYGQDYASNEYQNVYNRIANIAGLGQVASQGSGNAALYAGSRMGAAAGARGINSAYGAIGSGNAWAGAAQDIARLPWGEWFPGKGGGGGGSSPPLFDSPSQFLSGKNRYS